MRTIKLLHKKRAPESLDIYTISNERNFAFVSGLALLLFSNRRKRSHPEPEPRSVLPIIHVGLMPAHRRVM